MESFVSKDTRCDLTDLLVSDCGCHSCRPDLVVKEIPFDPVKMLLNDPSA